jgi:hypothetical protein
MVKNALPILVVALYLYVLNILILKILPNFPTTKFCKYWTYTLFGNIMLSWLHSVGQIYTISIYVKSIIYLQCSYIFSDNREG